LLVLQEAKHFYLGSVFTLLLPLIVFYYI